VTASFAIGEDVVVLGDLKLGFGVLARLAEYELVDEDVEEVSHTVLVVSSVDDVTFGFVVESSLSSEFATEELGRVYITGLTKSVYTVSTALVKSRKEKKKKKTDRKKVGSTLLRRRPCWGRLQKGIDSVSIRLQAMLKRMSTHQS
jgi:NAD(P)H-flavin reductase